MTNRVDLPGVNEPLVSSAVPTELLIESLRTSRVEVVVQVILLH